MYVYVSPWCVTILSKCVKFIFYSDPCSLRTIFVFPLFLFLSSASLSLILSAPSLPLGSILKVRVMRIIYPKFSVDVSAESAQNNLIPQLDYGDFYDYALAKQEVCSPHLLSMYTFPLYMCILYIHAFDLYLHILSTSEHMYICFVNDAPCVSPRIGKSVSS